MLFYFFLIVFTCILFNYAYNINKQSYRLIFSIISIIPASIIAGLRDLNIGQDLMGYGILFYDWAKYAKSITYLCDIETKEYGYHVLNYICHNIYGDIHFFLFVTEFVKLLLIVLSILSFRGYLKHGYLILLTYMLFMYCEGLSLIRQSLALAICLYSLTFYFKNKYLYFTFTVIIAYFFHNSAIVFFILPLLNVIYRKFKKPMLIIVLAVFLTYISASTLFMIIVDSGLFKDTLADRYLDSGVTLAKTNILLVSWIILSTYVLQKYSTCKDEYLFLIKANSLLALLFLTLSSYFEVAFRISFYQVYILMILYLHLLCQVRNKSSRSLSYFIYVSLYILHFMISAKHEMAGTIPYTSKILGL